MPGVFFGPHGENNSTYATPAGGNAGTRPAGHTLILPDGREYRFTLNDATAEVAGRLYQAATAIAGHTNIVADVARAIGATAVSATLNTTAATTDLYSEGMVHVNDLVGEGYAYRIKRANATGDGHASATATGILTVNLVAGETVQVALDTTSEVSFSHSRFRVVLIHDSPPTGALVGVSPGVAAASRWYWSQVRGSAAVLVQGTVIIGDFCVPSATVDGAVMPSAAFETDGPYVGIVQKLGNATTDGEESLIDLKIG